VAGAAGRGDRIEERNAMMPSGDAGALRRHKYAVLLVVLLTELTLQSFGGATVPEGRWRDAVATVLGVAIFLVVFEPGAHRMAMAGILAAFVGIGWTRQSLPAALDHEVSLAYQTLTAIFLWAAVWVILRSLFSTRTVGVENVLGAICGYLIAGAGWSSVNALAFLLAPAAFSVDPHVSALLADWHGRAALFSYYSLAQMLTIGYADVTPVRAPATTISLFSALFGVFYTAVVVSQFVGMAQSARDKP
jgi:hypothetical protein